MIHLGVVENRDDPLKLGRCQVRVIGLHSEDKLQLPTDALPWAIPMLPITTAAVNGIGWSPTGLVPGTWVIVLFQDIEQQMPIMLGTVGGIPQSKSAEKIALDGMTVTTNKSSTSTNIVQDLSTLLLSLFSGSNKTTKSNAAESDALGTNDTNSETIIPAKVEPTPEALADDAQPPDGNPTSATSATLKLDIPTKPPSKYASNIIKQESCIKALINACDKLGLTSKYAKCAILAICGGESEWLPVEEKYNYSASNLLKIFPGVFQGDQIKAAAYAKWKGTREAFFNEIYSPKYKNGKGVGNTEPDDGGKYFGRGFNQITGRALYAQLEKALKAKGIDAPLLKTPNILINDIEKSALATVMYYVLNVKVPHDSPNYFEAALKRTGGAESGKNEKRTFYQYFLGEGVLKASTTKSVEDIKTYKEAEVKYLPKNKQNALLETRTENNTTGFLDPSGKYPLRNLLDEPDTNRLARGVIKETAIEFKDSVRTLNIPTANNSDGAWEQPIAPYGGIYPYNKVYETESGHLMTFDDSPGHETVSVYHRTGTFIDIDANGTQVNKIIGDGYIIMDRNGFITIEGKCNVHIGGDTTLLVEGNADIEVKGSTNAVFHNDVDLNCANDLNINVGRNMNLRVAGDINTRSNNSNIRTTNDSINYAGNDYLISSLNSASMVSSVTDLQGLETTNIYGTSTKIYSTGAIDMAGDGGVNLLSKLAFISLNTGAHIGAAGSVEIKGDSKVAVTGGMSLELLGGFFANLNGGISTNVGNDAMEADPNIPDRNTVQNKILTIPTVLPPNNIPAIIPAANPRFEILQTPVRPSPAVLLKIDVSAANAQLLDKFNKNPNQFYNAQADSAGVNPERIQPPNIGEVGQSLKSGADSSDIKAFLEKQIALGKEGYWSETGMNGKGSNPNILAMWRDLGLGQIGKTDQIAWCMVFVNWVLKQCNYRYVQTARAFDLRDKPTRWNAIKVTTPEPGDIVVWSYSHVNFVYDVLANGNITCCGGNQGGKKIDNNNPAGGKVTVNYEHGISPKHNTIIGIYRPSKD